MTLYLDLDGVFADFDGHLKSYGIHRNKTQNSHHMPKHTWSDEQKAFDVEITKLMGLSGFWEAIPLCQGAYKLWDFCSLYHPVILTAIPTNPDWKEQITLEKNKWIDKYLGFRIPRIICLRSEKQKYAGSYYDILVDDTIQNISEWTEAGGFGIFHTDIDNTIKKLQHILKEVH